MKYDQKPSRPDVKSPDDAYGAEGDTADLAELRRALAKLKSKVADQQGRIEALARGRQEGMQTISRLRAELALVSGERDRLRRELTAVEGMQTETMAQDESGAGDEVRTDQTTPASIDDLMGTFGAGVAVFPTSHSTQMVDSTDAGASAEYQEMLSPDVLMLPPGARNAATRLARYFVMVQDDEPVRCPLEQDLMTIGRSESADIPIDGDFISRIHARVLRIGVDSVIEDAGSKNGTWVNGERIERHVLRNGDLIRVGSGNLRYVESRASEQAQ